MEDEFHSQAGVNGVHMLGWQVVVGVGVDGVAKGVKWSKYHQTNLAIRLTHQGSLDKR